MTSHPFITIFIFLFSFLSLPTDPKFLRRLPDKELINLEWPYCKNINGLNLAIVIIDHRTAKFPGYTVNNYYDYGEGRYIAEGRDGLV